jgi:hypothetical protein
MDQGFVWTVSPATLAAIAGWVVSVLAFVWSRSSDEASQKNLTKANAAGLEALQKLVAGLDTELDARISAIQGGQALMREQMHEHREVVARNYMPRNEIMEMERRLSDTTARIMERMDKFETRLDTMQERILAAIAGMRKEAAMWSASASPALALPNVEKCTASK